MLRNHKLHKYELRAPLKLSMLENNTGMRRRPQTMNKRLVDGHPTGLVDSVHLLIVKC